MMDPMLESFRAEMTRVALHAPKTPYISNLTGTWITAAEATDPLYWARHLRNAVQFSRGLEELFHDPSRTLSGSRSRSGVNVSGPPTPRSSEKLASIRVHKASARTGFGLRAVARHYRTAVDCRMLHRLECLTWRRDAATNSTSYLSVRTSTILDRTGWKFLAGKRPAGNPVADSPKDEFWFHQRVWKRLSTP